MSNAAPIAVQLYSVREQMEGDLTGTIRQVADMGYVGVEPFGLDAAKAKAQAALFADLGLVVPGAHSKLPLGDDKNEVLDVMGELNCPIIICPFLPAEDFQSVDSIRRVCDQLNEAQAVAAANGLKLAYHNHWWEFYPVADTGKTGHAIMLETLDPAVLMEIDTYWVTVGGSDPVDVIRALGSRAPLLHIKDGPAVNHEDPMVAVGDGAMDFHAIISAGAAATQWLVVELDRCAADMMAAVGQSYAYLVGEGLARGR